MNDLVVRDSDPSASLCRRAAAALGLLFLSALPAVAAAQVTVEPRVGMAVGGGAFGDYIDAGPSASLRVGFGFRPGTSLFVDGGIDRFGSRELIEETVTGPELDAMRLAVGLEQELISESLPASYDPWSLRLRLGVGAMRLKSDTFRHVDGDEDFTFSSTSPMAAVGMAIGYTLAGMATVFVDMGMNWAYVDEDKTVNYARLAPTYVDQFESARTFPYSVGVRLPF